MSAGLARFLPLEDGDVDLLRERLARAEDYGRRMDARHVGLLRAIGAQADVIAALYAELAQRDAVIAAYAAACRPAHTPGPSSHMSSGESGRGCGSGHVPSFAPTPVTTKPPSVT